MCAAGTQSVEAANALWRQLQTSGLMARLQAPSRVRLRVRVRVRVRVRACVRVCVCVWVCVMVAGDERA